MRSFPGASCEDMKDYIKPLLNKKPKNIILHTGTNNSVNENSRTVFDKILTLKSQIEQALPSSTIVISSLITRFDNAKASLTVSRINELLKTVKINIIENNNITNQHLNKHGLHLNEKGSGKLALNFIKKIKELNKK